MKETQNAVSLGITPLCVCVRLSLCSLRLPARSHGAPVRELQVLEGSGRDEV